MIRPYHPADADRLFPLYREAMPDPPATAAALGRRLSHLINSGGFAWVLLDGQRLIGYAAVSSLPGLDRVMSLEGFIDPARRRQGSGRQLLDHLVQVLKQRDIRQLSQGVPSLDSPAAHFLLSNGFTVEHQEWLMQRSRLDDLPSLPTADLRSDSRAAAIRHFRALYDRSFAGKPWYQPYTDAEVAATLRAAGDLLFLFEQDTPIGFVWVRHTGGEIGEIEPIGVAETHQGRGHGRTLLLAGLHRLKDRGATTATIGAWQDNDAALRLYQGLGFRHAQTVTYLALDL